MGPPVTPDPPTSVFDADAIAYEAYLKTPLGHLRTELTWHGLWQAMSRMGFSATDPPGDALRVLDIGGGNGDCAIRLAEQGCHVTLVDSSPAMLELAQARRRSLPAHAQSRLDLQLAPAESADQLFSPGTFDVVLCHSVLDFVSDSDSILGAMSTMLRLAGLLSCLVSNRDCEALRLSVLAKNPEAARAALRAQTFPTALFGGVRRAFSAAELRALLRRHGFRPRSERGIRIFADYLPQEHLADPLLRRRLWHLELAAAGKLPHRRIARYLHMLAIKL